jgi:sulfur-oxidizing protein SoxY
MDARSHVSRATRRQLLAATGSLVAGAALAPLLTVRHADATPDTMTAAIRDVIGEANVRPGRVKLDLPPLVENGNTVSMGISVESPMSEADYVKSVHIFNEKNPQPNVINFHFGPRAGKASASTRIRLADTQHVVAIAQMSDGSFWSDTVHVVVTLAACLEEARP